MKRNIILLTCILTAVMLSARQYQRQHKFNVEIEIPDSIDVQKVTIQYNNGFVHKDGRYVYKGNKIVIQDTLLAKYSTVYINMPGSNKFSIFWITGSPAIIKIKTTGTTEDFDLYNAQNVQGAAWKELTNISAEAVAKRSAFYNAHPDYLENDSLKNIFTELTNQIKSRQMAYLEQHCNDYFSFWYFITTFTSDVLQPQQLIAFFKKVFPIEFTESAEGKIFLEYQNARLVSGIKIKAKDFQCKTIDGASYKLASFKNKFLLLDYWASWCGPCLQNSAIISDIRDKYSTEDLAILAISKDDNYEKFCKAIRAHNMNKLLNVFGDYQLLNQFTALGMPTYILIDRQGYIIYNSNNCKDYNLELLNNTLASKLENRNKK